MMNPNQNLEIPTHPYEKLIAAWEKIKLCQLRSNLEIGYIVILLLKQYD